jgi:NAD(P)-dependent dehydrogenase (short-subunit alcohol dehydrogenase family)
MAQKWVLITGVCGGIGRASAAAFNHAGWKVIGVDRADPLEPLELERFETVDVSQSNQIADLFTRLNADLDGLHALVNNAAIQINKPIVETEDADWELIINTNVRSAFQCIRGAHPLLAAVRGAVVNVSSVHAIATSMNVAVYAISKGALVALTRSAALELAADGVRCNAVLPGAIDTKMLREGLDRRSHPDGAEGNLRILAQRTPLGFVATADDIAPSILHLADNEQSKYTTGQMLVLDGGATIRLSTE